MKKTDTIIPAAVTLVMLALAWFLIFPLVISKTRLQGEIVESFGTLTGMKLEIQDDIAVSMSPAPHILLRKMYVENINSSRTSFLATVENADITLSLGSIFGGKPHIKAISVNGVSLNLEVMDSGELNVQAAAKKWQNSKVDIASRATNESFNFKIQDAKINYYNPATAKDITLSDINLAGDFSGSDYKTNAIIHFNYRNTPLALTTHITGDVIKLFTPDKTLLDITLEKGKDSVNYKGNFTYNHAPQFNGDLKVESEDIAGWIDLLSETAKDTTVATSTKLPVSLSTKIEMNDVNSVHFPEITLKGETITGKAVAAWILPNKIEMNAAIDSLNLENVIGNNTIMSFIASATNTRNTNDSAKKYTSLIEKNTLELSSNVTIADSVYNQKHIHNTRFSIDMAGNEMVIPQLLAKLPGESSLSFSGIGRDTLSGYALEGQIDIQGNSFAELLSLFKSTQFSLPVSDFKRFHLKTNMVSSPREIRLSELVARIEKMGIEGEMIAHLGSRMSVEAGLNIQSLNLDAIIKQWGLDNWRKAFFDNDKLTTNSGTVSMWLKNLGYDFKINASLENYLLGNVTYDQTTFNAVASANKVQVNNIDAEYKHSHFKGKMDIDVSGEVPVTNMSFIIDKINGNDYSDTAKEKGKWLTNAFDFSWFDIVNGNFSFKIGRFIQDEIEISDIELLGSLENRKLKLAKFQGVSLGASMVGNATISGGTIPGITLQGNILGIKPELMAPFFPMLDVFSGTFNVGVSVASNGINVASWLSNLEGSLGASGRDIEIKHFNLAGVVRAVSYVRTVADILNVVKRAFHSGNTIFQKLDGNFSVSKGIIETSNTKIYSPQSEGSISGGIDISKAIIKSSAVFTLNTLDNKDTNITVNVAGSLDNPEIEFDTRSLEQYVNTKTSSNMMQERNNH